MTETSNSPMTARVRAFLDRPHRLLIGGEWVDAASGKTFETRDPATGEVLATVAHAEQADIDAAVAAARTGVRGQAPAWHGRGACRGGAGRVAGVRRG
ncbi:aldehyde dehydrogenase family protein, partial [Micrococcus luteus]|nr:aldehyde dehydrogenase family protein [Micrococcus luteus]